MQRTRCRSRECVWVCAAMKAGRLAHLKTWNQKEKSNEQNVLPSSLYMVRRLSFPGPRQRCGLVGGGRAGGCKKRGRGRCRWTVGWCWGRPGVTRKPYASHKPYNARAPAFIDLNRYFAPYTPNPKPRLNLNAGSKPKAEHKPSTLTNLHPKSSLSPCRLEAL